MKCPSCGSATTLRKVRSGTWWHVMEWCPKCKAAAKTPGHWVPHRDIGLWGFQWLEEVPDKEETRAPQLALFM